MIDITFDEDLRRSLPDFAVGVVEADVQVTEHDPELWKEINARVAELTGSLDVADIPQLPGVAGLRKAYRTLGKDPTRYRGSQEALIRRILKGKGLYRINTVVDINNLMSIETYHSGGLFDAAKIEPPVVFRAGREGETYVGIGRDVINIAGMPVVVDQQGPFGSPTSDSERTKVTLDTRRIVATILSFTGRVGLDRHCQRMLDLLERYAHAGAGHSHFHLIP